PRFARLHLRRLSSAGQEVELVSRPSGTDPFTSLTDASTIAFGRQVSDGGRYVAFQSRSASLPGTAAGALQQVFVRDLVAGTTTLVSRGDGGAGAAADKGASVAGISGDGRRIVFS